MKLTARGSIVAAVAIALAASAAAVFAQGAATSGRVSGLVGAQPLAIRAPAGAPQIPDLSEATAWDNSAPLTNASLRGQVVLVDFWDASCINCRRTFPFLRALYATYRSRGLVIVGVHTPEFDFEKAHSYVARTTNELGITWPVAEDPNHVIWDAFGNQYWPAQYLVDRQGRFRAGHVGEGDDAAIEDGVRLLLNEGGQAGSARAVTGASSPSPDTSAVLTPELYLGAQRQGANPAVLHYAGHYSVAADERSPDPGASCVLEFRARDVFAVLSPGTTRSVQFRILLDGRPVPADRRGPDVTVAPDGSTEVVVGRQDLFHLVIGSSVAEGHLTLTALDPGAQMFTFTFGG